MRKDNQLMSLLSIWGIFLVVLGHSGFEEPIIQHRLGYLHSWIYSFHMPLFFMISGYLFSFTNKNFGEVVLGDFLWKKVKRLLVPYIVLGVILYFIKFAFSGLSHAARDFTIGNFFKMFLAPSSESSTMGYLWFVFTLFIVFAFIVAICRMHINLKKTTWCISLILAFGLIDYAIPQIEWFNLKAVVHYMPYFLIGILFKSYESSILAFVNRGGYCELFILIALSIWTTIGNWSVPSFLMITIRTLIGLWMSVSFCSLLLYSNKITIWQKPYGKNTYSIYLLSWFGQYAAKILVVNIFHMHWGICVIAMFICGIAVPLMINWCVDRYKLNNVFLRLVIGY